MSARKRLEPGCTLGIDCPLPGHTETVTGRGGRWTFRHVHLTDGQKREHRDRVLAEMRAKKEWQAARFGPRNYQTGLHEDGTDWREADDAYREHLASEARS